MKTFLKKIIIAIITWQAKQILRKYKPRVVAVTGSVGKTSTKDAIYSVLKTSFKVRKSDKSFNSEIGIPLTILGCPNGWSNFGIWSQNLIKGFSLILFKKSYPAWLVLEVGADRPGDIRSVAKWLHPDVVVITKFSKVPVHVEFFSSPEAVMEEKKSLAWALKPNGVLILNHDDEDVLVTAEKSKAQTITYGLSEQANIIASNYSIMYETKGNKFPTGIAFKVDYEGSSVPIVVKHSLGRTHLYPLLAAVAVAVSEGLNLVTISSALNEHVVPPGRMNLIEGNKESMIIDDTYNSSPVALQEALATFKEIKKNRYKIAVLGDMLEIGKYTVEEHHKAGEKVAKIADLLVTVGLRSRQIAQGALDGGMSEKNIFQFEASLEAGRFIETILEPGDILLVKGSQGARMEKIVEEIMAHPEDKEKLLVRQDREWQKR